MVDSHTHTHTHTHTCSISAYLAHGYYVIYSFSETVVGPEEPLTLIREEVMTEATTEAGVTTGGREGVRGEATTTV